MIEFIESVEKSVETENWYAALAVALTIPDICGWLSDPSVKSGPRYKAWCEEYLTPKYTVEHPLMPATVFLSADDTYALRCAYLHEGADDVSRQNARDALTRFVFSSGGAHCNLLRQNGNAVLNLAVPHFCADMASGGRSWLSDVENDPDVQARLGEFVKVHTSDHHIAPGIVIRVER